MQLPEIVAVDHFDSKRAFRNRNVTSPREVLCYEVEFYKEDFDGISVVNGKEFSIKKDTVLSPVKRLFCVF